LNFNDGFIELCTFLSHAWAVCLSEYRFTGSEDLEHGITGVSKSNKNIDRQHLTLAVQGLLLVMSRIGRGVNKVR
jgi:hypothetical protein